MGDNGKLPFNRQQAEDFHRLLLSLVNVLECALDRYPRTSQLRKLYYYLADLGDIDALITSACEDST